VSATPTPVESAKISQDGAPQVDPFHNPTYPARTHFHDREKLQSVLRDAEERLSTTRQKLGTMDSHPRRAEFVRLYHQLMGARDQIADCARRIPLEAADLYNEDQERYHNAVAAFERIWNKWEAAGK
jgi:hypothetical protein